MHFLSFMLNSRFSRQLALCLNYLLEEDPMQAYVICHTSYGPEKVHINTKRKKKKSSIEEDVVFKKKPQQFFSLGCISINTNVTSYCRNIEVQDHLVKLKRR